MPGYENFEDKIYSLVQPLSVFAGGMVTRYDFGFLAKTRKTSCTVRQGSTFLKKKYLGSSGYTATYEVLVDICIPYVPDRWYDAMKDACQAVEVAVMTGAQASDNNSIIQEVMWLPIEPMYGESGSGPHTIRRTLSIKREDDTS